MQHHSRIEPNPIHKEIQLQSKSDFGTKKPSLNTSPHVLSRAIFQTFWASIVPKSVFNAAQPGVGRVQVLGSKKLLSQLSVSLYAQALR